MNTMTIGTSTVLVAASSRRRIALVPVAAPPQAPVIVNERDIR